jgi:hypothetical protein
MNCQSCSTEILPIFVIAVKENRCPACGSEWTDESSHAALFSVVNSLKESSNMPEDICIKAACSIREVFDVFPKGSVVDGLLTEEVKYVYVKRDRVPRIVYDDEDSVDLEGLALERPADGVRRSGSARRSNRDHYESVRLEAEQIASDNLAPEAKRALSEFRAKFHPDAAEADYDDGDESPVRSTADLQEIERERREMVRIENQNIQRAGVRRR